MANVTVEPAPVWWSNLFFFCGMHVAGLIGAYYKPLWYCPTNTALLCFLSWQLAIFGITVGYHRLYSHRSFRARRPLRLVLTLLGTLGFQGSVKWWCARHRLHHRYTDDPAHDPYCATKGLYYSHMGWIFRKPAYVKMRFIDLSDLNNDPVVVFQHRYYIPLALGLGLLLPALIATLWDDTWGGFVWGGIIARLLIWHCTFIVNSFAHWDGLRPYSEETTARGNLLMALLTGGEGNHNFHHAFPRDYRASPHTFDWDPSKWIIHFLHKYTGLVTSVYVTDEDDIATAKSFVGTSQPISPTDDEAEPEFEQWNEQRIRLYLTAGHSRSILFLDGFIIDVTDLLSSHPGGFAVLKPYVISGKSLARSPESGSGGWKDASWAFGGGLNNHSNLAKRQMRALRIGRQPKNLPGAIG